MFDRQVSPTVAGSASAHHNTVRDLLTVHLRFCVCEGRVFKAARTMTMSPTTSSLIAVLDGAPSLSTVTVELAGKQPPPDAQRTHSMAVI